MIDQSHQLPILLVVALTVLSFVIGYCVASIRGRGAARTAIESTEAQMMVGAGNMSKSDAKASSTEVVSAVDQSAEDGRPAKPATSQSQVEMSERERLLHAHMQLQARRIQRLDAQITEFKRLYSKSQDGIQVNLVEPEIHERANLGRKLNLEDLPILSRRVGDAANNMPENPAAQESVRRKPLRPISKELEIPVLAESELPETSEGWQADVTTGSDTNDRAGRRG